MLEILRQGLAAQGLDATKAETLEAFARAVLEKNKVMNLTAITEDADFARLHLLDSAALLTMADFGGKRVVDVGTGAGFPGVPLRILCPDARVTLLDSTGKRIDFLRETCDALGLTDVDCVHERAEAFAAQQRERFDCAVSRAVAGMSVLCELCLPLVKVGGQFLAMKSARSDEELEGAMDAIQTLGGRLADVVDYPIPTAGVTHRVMIIDKVERTPKQYPRQFGKIKKSPL
ncbi:MAG: 16S rRNA (guanine(527)-N(7))-methyltransferase RsmG [Oscillospiraceae bacterium]|nr:16S rRNA (guanine(527)-N(7))-methyltransferase RsmG [Oscillospiraceae bacterium]